MKPSTWSPLLECLGESAVLGDQGEEGRSAVAILYVHIEDCEATRCASRAADIRAGRRCPPRFDLRLVGRRVLESARGKRILLTGNTREDHPATSGVGKRCLEHRRAHRAPSASSSSPSTRCLAL